MSLKCNIQFSRCSSHEEIESRLTKIKKIIILKLIGKKCQPFPFVACIYRIYMVLLTCEVGARRSWHFCRSVRTRHCKCRNSDTDSQTPTLALCKSTTDTADI